MPCLAPVMSSDCMAGRGRGICACRFDRQISIDRPDITGREQIFRIHLAKLKLSKPVDYFSERLAALTPSFAGRTTVSKFTPSPHSSRASSCPACLYLLKGAVNRVFLMSGLSAHMSKHVQSCHLMKAA